MDYSVGTWSWEGSPQDGELYLQNLGQGPQEREKHPWGFQQGPRGRNHFEKRQNSCKQGLTPEETSLVDWALTATIFTCWSISRASRTRGMTDTLQLDLIFPVGGEKCTPPAQSSHPGPPQQETDSLKE